MKYRLIYSLLLLCLCISLITGATYAWMVKTPDNDSSFSLTVGSVDIRLDDADLGAAPDALRFDLSSASTAQSELRFTNYSTLETCLKVVLVPVWQEADPLQPDSFNDLPLPAGDIRLWCNGEEVSVGGAYEHILPPGDGEVYSLVVKVQANTTLYAGSLCVKVFAEAASTGQSA